MDLLEALTSFVDKLGIGLFPLPPKRDTIAGFVPDFSELTRDPQGFFCQLQADGSLDGGDSAHKSGFAAFCNGETDQALLERFETGGVMVRHPNQFPWNNWRNCSRDQLTAYTAGCWRAGRFDISSRLFDAHAARFPPFTCQNTENDAPGTTKDPPIGDPMLPHDVMCLNIAKGNHSSYLGIAEQLSLQIAIETADPDPGVEKNQLILEAIICGRLDLYVRVHPNYADNIREYWSGWRGEPQVAEAFIAVIQLELQRYHGRLPIPLLPANVLNFLRGLDLWAEFTNLDPAHRAVLMGRFADAAIKDAANYYITSLMMSVEVAVAALNALGATANRIAVVMAELNQVPNVIRSGLEALGLPQDVISQAMLLAFPGIPHTDFAATPHADFAAVPHTDIAAVHTDIGAAHTDTTTGHTDGTSGHADSGWPIHSDIGGVHTDIGGVHADVITSPHVDAIVAEHTDTPPAAHVDVPPVAHVDTP